MLCFWLLQFGKECGLCDMECEPEYDARVRFPEPKATCLGAIALAFQLDQYHPSFQTLLFVTFSSSVKDSFDLMRYLKGEN